ncbi:hypothetical protein ACN42_g7308 [Penicillium freii]|uniref:Uncharacterized protein n=1 Tax=Penicillium freii TaxID=48697 RepID=A0A117NMW1_PENFR|nr:hypothetical protein ACN42_g7308 [Penicillium freii]
MAINPSRPDGATSSEMRLQSIPEKSKQIIDDMRALIEKDETDHLKMDTSGWQYGGKSFTELVVSLQKETKEDLQHQSINVIFCTVRHFFKGVNITLSDPTKRVLVIPN